MLEISPEIKEVFEGHNYSGEIIMLSLSMKYRYSLSYKKVEEIGRLKELDADRTTILR
jgi:putative transposase